MLNVFYDHQKFSTQKFGGISRYFANLIHDIKNRPDFDYTLGVLNTHNYYLKGDQFLLNNPAASFLISKRVLKPYKLNQLYCNYLLKKGNFDIFHPTYYDPYFIGKTNKPVVTTIHDMTYEMLPEYFWAADPLTKEKRMNIERADAIIAISEATKADLLAISNVDPAKITVIYHGIDPEFITKKVDGLPAHYLLFVGDRSGYKNFYNFIKAFQVLSQQFPDLHAVLTGGGPMQIADQEFIHRLKLSDKVTHTNVSDEELNYLYEHAVAFVYPSLYEGFGYPILEAYKAKCPVVLSDIACFREVAGDAAVYFNAFDVEQLTHLLAQVVTDTALREELVLKGTRRLADFPLQQSIDQTLALYKSLL